MYCKHCMRMIDDDAIFCPACGKSQQKPVKKPFFKRWWFWVIAVILVIGFTGGSGEPELVESNGHRETQTAVNTPAYFTVGDTAELNDVYVTLTKAYESRGSEFFEADLGKVYLICEFEIRNESSNELNVSSVLCFNAYVDDYSINSDIYVESISDVPSLDGTVAAGKKMKGAIAYEVNQTWKTLEIYFNPDVWSNNQDFIFAVNH